MHILRRAWLPGLILGLGIVGWTFTMGLTGWYRDPERANLFGLVLPFQIAVVITTLRATRAQHTYTQQVAIGVVLSLLGAAFAFVGSLLFTTVAFPSYFADLREVAIANGASEADLRETAWTQTSIFSASAGAIGTTLTGLAVSAITAIFARKK